MQSGQQGCYDLSLTCFIEYNERQIVFYSFILLYNLLYNAEEDVKAKEENKEPIQKVCPSCGFRIFDAETMFCNDCGRRLVPESELNQ